MRFESSKVSVGRWTGGFWGLLLPCQPVAQLILTTYGKGILMQNLLFVVVYALTIVLLWWPLWSTRYVVDPEAWTIRISVLSGSFPKRDTSRFLKQIIPSVHLLCTLDPSKD